MGQGGVVREKILWRLLLPVIYAVLLSVAIVYLFTMAPTDEFCGLPAMMLSLPWSVLSVFLVAIISPGVLESSLIPGVVLILISGGIWIYLLWRLGRVLDRKRIVKNSKEMETKK